VAGRFAQADTIIPGLDNPLAWDRYAYVNNNPITYFDPGGHIALPIIIAIIAFVSSLVPQFSGDSYNHDYIDMTIEEQNQDFVDSNGASLYLGTGVLAIGELGIGACNYVNIKKNSIANNDVRKIKVELDINEDRSHIGEFNIIDWKDYPEGIPKPKGTVRILTGQEYIKNR
jgi:hypothetical protein